MRPRSSRSTALMGLPAVLPAGAARCCWLLLLLLLLCVAGPLDLIMILLFHLSIRHVRTVMEGELSERSEPTHRTQSVNRQALDLTQGQPGEPRQPPAQRVHDLVRHAVTQLQPRAGTVVDSPPPPSRPPQDATPALQPVPAQHGVLQHSQQQVVRQSLAR